MSLLTLRILPSVMLAVMFLLLLRLVVQSRRPVFTTYMTLLCVRIYTYFYHDPKMDTFMALVFAAIQPALVVDTVVRVGRGSRAFLPFCILIGCTVALGGLAGDPMGPEQFSMEKYLWHTGLHLMCFGAMVASLLLYVGRELPEDRAEMNHQRILALYFGASVIADLPVNVLTSDIKTLVNELLHLACFLMWLRVPALKFSPPAPHRDAAAQ